jgi:hypothetical protein
VLIFIVYLKGEETVVEDMVHVSTTDEDDTTKWLSVLLHTKFGWLCKEHRWEMSLIYVYFSEVVYPHCTHNKPSHRPLKVRRYAYRSIILIRDMHSSGTCMT